jgi:Uma2 family endonuclease
MTTITKQATVEDLRRAPGKAELVNGEVVLMAPTGDTPGRAGDFIFASLFEHERRTRQGRAFSDNKAFVVNLPHRKSFSPDAAYHFGRNTGMEFLEGAPAFAAEVRSKSDYGPAPEREMAAKRADYFAAGTLVVWDVDLLNRDVVRVYRASDPKTPKVYRPGEMAEAEPAVPGWTMPVDDLFES